MNRDVFLNFVRKNIVVIVAGAVALAVLLLAANMFSETGDGSEEADLEMRLCNFLRSMEGVGECEVFVCFSLDGSASGVAVLCSGGGNAKIKADVEDVLSRVLRVPPSNIIVGKLIKD